MQQAITFDFHNTLVQCDPWFELEVRSLCSALLRWRDADSLDPELGELADRRYAALRQSIIAHGHELPAERCVEVVLDQLGVRHDPQTIAAGVRAIMMETLGDASPIPGAVSVVQALANQDVKLAIVSSAVYHPFLLAALAAFDMRDAFSSIVTSASTGFYKSRPEIFWSALDAVGARASSSIHLGDSHRFDVLGAQRAGMGTIWLSDDPDAALESPPPDRILPSLINSSDRILETLSRFSACAGTGSLV